MEWTMGKKMVIPVTIFLVAASLVFPHAAQAAHCDENDVIFSELDYQQQSSDNAEFLELYISGGWVLSACEIRFVDKNGVAYRTVNLSGNDPSVRYLVIGAVPESHISFPGCTIDCIDNQKGAGFALFDTSGGTCIWHYTYGGSATYDACTNVVFPVEDMPSDTWSLINGPEPSVDDVVLTSQPSPGSPNAPTAIVLSELKAASASANPCLAGIIGVGVLVVVGGGLVVLWRQRK
jgi:hypothetical protein